MNLSWICLTTVLWVRCFAAEAGFGSILVVNPPVITLHPNYVSDHLYIRKDSPLLLLPCLCDGGPVQFSWFRNKVFVQPKPIATLLSKSTPGLYFNAEPPSVHDLFNGSLVIVGDNEANTGAYQCFASLIAQPRIRAMSEIAYVHQVYFVSFSAPDMELKKKSVTKGDYVKLQCPPLDMSPPPQVTWKVVDQPVQLIDNRRIVQDDQGTLHILSVMPNGSEFAGQLQCEQFNTRMDAFARGRATTLTLSNSQAARHESNEVSPVYITLATGEQAVYCIFSENPPPTVNWTRVDKRKLGAGVVADGALLVFRNATLDDSATYQCAVSNAAPDSASSTTHVRKFTVVVRSAPRTLPGVTKASRVEKTVGDDVSLNCGAEGEPMPTYSWFFNTVPLDIVKNNGNFMPPLIIQQPNQYRSHFFTQRTSKTLLPCVASGSSDLRFQWQRNGVVVPPVPIPADLPSGSGAFYNDKPNIVGGIFNGTMVVYGTGDSLLGAYQCFASLNITPHVRAMSDIAYVHEQYFTLFPAPSLTLTTKSVAAGEYVQLVCAALVMSPMPLVTWELKNQPKAPLIDNQRIVLDDKGTLHILSAAPKGYEFSGQLQCIQHNAEVNAYARGQPTVLTLDTSVNMGYRAPKVVYVSDSPKYILAGDWDGTDEQLMSHTAYCIFSANPAPRVQWTRADGAALGTGIVAKGPLLWFRNAVVSDSGSYVCTAVNTNGNVDSAPVTQQIRVEVRSKPVLIHNVSTLVKRAVGEDVVIDCGAGGSPSPSYKWYINSVPAREYTEINQDISVEGSQLSVYRLNKSEDNWLFTCNASNAAGSVMRTVGIKVYTPKEGDIQKQLVKDNIDSPVLRLSDLDKRSIGVFSCNVSNAVGHKLLSFALNVFNKSRLQATIYNSSIRNLIELRCTAQVDAGLHFDLYWKRLPNGDENKDASQYDNGRLKDEPQDGVYVSLIGSEATVKIDLNASNTTQQRLKWIGGTTYECVLETTTGNLSSLVFLKQVLELDESFRTFWLALIGGTVALVFAVVCLALAFYCGCRKQGESHIVDELELVQGNNPLA